MTFPVNFESLAKGPKSASGGGYPAQISGGDLMKDFKYAALDANEGLITESGGARKLTIPAPSGTNKVLGCDGSSMSWKDDIPIAPNKECVLIAIAGTLSWIQAPTTGTHVLGVKDGTLQWLSTEEC